MRKLTLNILAFLLIVVIFHFAVGQQPLIRPIVAKLGHLLNVSSTANSPTDNYVLIYDSSTGLWGPEAIAGAGDVDTSGTPVDDDFAKFTDADTIEGRSYSETKDDLGLNTTDDPTFNDLTIDKLEANESFTYDAVQTATGDGTTTVVWGSGNLMYFTFGAMNETFTFTAPPGAASPLILWLKQDGTGSRTATWPATVHWPGDVIPTLSTGANDVDIVSFAWDGTNYFGLFNGNFY